MFQKYSLSWNDIPMFVTKKTQNQKQNKICQDLTFENSLRTEDWFDAYSFIFYFFDESKRCLQLLIGMTFFTSNISIT